MPQRIEVPGQGIIEFPDGMTDDQIAAAIRGVTPAEKPFAVKTGEALSQIPRQVGLTARYGIEGLGQLASIGTEPLRQFVVNPLARAVGAREAAPTSQVASDLANALGLPSPQGANERVVGDMARTMAGAGGFGGAARAAQALPGVAGSLGRTMSANMPQQLVSAAGAGGAGGAVRESGGGPLEQFAASLAAGVAAPTIAGKVGDMAQRTAGAARNLVAPAQALRDVDQRISLTLRQQGIDWAQIPERIKQPLREEARQAMATGGDLNADALRRLIEFRLAGATPTRGMLTQDPVQITRERNLAKTGANSTDIGLQRLPRLENENAAALLARLDEAGASNAPDAFATGERVLGALNARAAASKSRIDELYKAARDTQGKSAALDGSTFTRAANQALDEQMLGYAVPADVQNRMNQIARGEVPFTVDFAEQFKTSLGNIGRADRGGATGRAMGVIRRALDDTPLRPAEAVNPVNLPAVPGTVPPSPAVLGADSIAAFNRARAANRAFMQRVENTPALEAALNGAQPDQFVRQYIVGQGASVRDVNALRQAVAGNRQALDAVRGNILAHLRGAATNNTDDVVKFNAASYNRALSNIGERKLSAFFDADEIRRLQAVGRASTLMTAQPAGTAVNNSNSGALLLGRALSMLDSVAGRLPLGLDATIQGTLRGVQQGRAMNVPSAIAAQPAGIPLDSRLLGPALYGGLLATQPLNDR